MVLGNEVIIGQTALEKLDLDGRLCGPTSDPQSGSSRSARLQSQGDSRPLTPRNITMSGRWSTVVVLVEVLALGLAAASSSAEDGNQGKEFRAGAAAVDITPTTLPAIVSGGFLERTADTVHDRLFARGLVLDDGTTKLAIVVADNLMMPRELLDRAKTLAEQATGIPVDHILISATHTHSAPSVMGALGTPSDEVYERGLPELLARAIEQAAGQLVPARVGWGVAQDPGAQPLPPLGLSGGPHGHGSVRAAKRAERTCIRATRVPTTSVRPDPRIRIFPFWRCRPGTDGLWRCWLITPCTISAQTPVSSDVCGRFGGALATLIGAEQDERFVGMLSQGTSGDSMWMDYSRPAAQIDAAAVHRVARASRFPGLPEPSVP